MQDIQRQILEAVIAAYYYGRHQAIRDSHANPGDVHWDNYHELAEIDYARVRGHRFRALELVYDALGSLT